MSGSRRNQKLLPALLLVVSIAVCVIGVYIFWSRMDYNDEQPKDMEGNAVSIEDGDLPHGSELKSMKVTEDNGTRLVVPSVGLNVGIGALSEVAGQITPPGFTNAYIVRNRGAGELSKANQQTLFVVTHSVNWGKAPGNYLIDVSDGKPAVHIGAQIEIGALKYKVTETETVLKEDLGSTSSVWENTPGRLVLITCLQREQGRSLKNVVIMAQMENKQ
ncbi:class F sortase [Bifidobacterium psychraerophilum]|uniref:Carboxylesterase type B n=1 Tax=Bifidobacterium psychraerophilum TaxID=218140 RepID=A0A087CG91_9BIFI|nr:class F sortase [Bifidobacterium psychraerophilum]KFI82291.1 carboxylesterase type B [Bifidobacterium psychraerophilum]PKA95093.1 hypothetical protein A9A89_1338 [Bifidobacterium psychraerophilum DSM 22366]